MSKQKKPFNPFYLLVVLCGLAFLVTACSYGTMSYRAVRSDGEQVPLMQWIDANGMMLMLVEVAALGAFSLLAMVTESFWERLSGRKAADRDSSERKSDEG